MTATKQTDLRRADALRNRERILDAAERMLERSPSATLADIAAAAGVARSTLHRRFSNRDALLAALQDRPRERPRGNRWNAASRTPRQGAAGQPRCHPRLRRRATGRVAPAAGGRGAAHRSGSGRAVRPRHRRLASAAHGRAAPSRGQARGKAGRRARARRRRARGSTSDSPTSPMHGCTPCGCAGGPTP